MSLRLVPRVKAINRESCLQPEIPYCQTFCHTNWQVRRLISSFSIHADMLQAKNEKNNSLHWATFISSGSLPLDSLSRADSGGQSPFAATALLAPLPPVLFQPIESYKSGEILYLRLQTVCHIRSLAML
ncbi:unnamed protein product [Protopolystoma xenopodis]|uniref:Uncharacterized protein n=1 Tax=Protopolystoma xenopodis TaxID=117903 RepID=A0A3S5AM49_9PLAT|nr:unnamed protein product [Protopolystoma xenopodis]